MFSTLLITESVLSSPVRINTQPPGSKTLLAKTTMPTEKEERHEQGRHRSCSFSLHVGMAVSNPEKNPHAGDIFTSREMGEAIEATLCWKVSYLYTERDWYSISHLDVVVAFLDSYDPRKIKERPFHVLVIAWVRNWYSRWLERPGYKFFDLALSSSNFGATFLRKRDSGVPVDVLLLATNPHRFHSGPGDSRFESDYMTAVSYWRAPRMFEDFEPRKVPFKGKLYGKGWENHANLQPIYEKFLDYKSVPLAYRSTKVVIDDANHVTRPWGSLNSRIFDALASGTLVITNNLKAKSVFPSIPTFKDSDDLVMKLNRYLEEDSTRKKLAKKLQDQVLRNHTYIHRAKEFRAILFSHFGSSWRPLPEPQSGKLNICTVVRTFSAQARSLESLLHTLIAPLEKLNGVVGNKIYVVNTDPEANNGTITPIYDAITSVNARFQKRYVNYVALHATERVQSFYGYVETDLVIETLRRESCDYLLITNGDNLYSMYLYDSVLGLMKERYGMIGFHFVSHHPRERKADDGSVKKIRNTCIEARFERKWIDLGAVLFQFSLFKDHRIKFLPQGKKTVDSFARDWHVVNQIGKIDGIKKRIAPQVLLIHQ